MAIFFRSFVEEELLNIFYNSLELMNASQNEKNPSILNSACALWRRLWLHPAFSTAPLEFWAATLDNGGFAYLSRYRVIGRASDLAVAIDCYEKVVLRTTSVSPDRPQWLARLSAALMSRYSLTGDPTDVERSLMLCDEVLDQMPQDSPHRAQYLGELCVRLRARYLLNGDVSDLERVIGILKAVLAMPHDTWNRPAFCTNLGNALRDRYVRTGNLADLTQAIEAFRRAMAEMKHASPDRFRNLNNLGTGLLSLYDHSADLRDLYEAVTCFREAVAGMPAGMQERIGYLTNLGSALSKCFARTGDIRDLHEAVRTQEKAVNDAPDKSPERPSYLLNLASTLMIRYGQTNSMVDLEDALRILEGAMRKTPGGSPKRVVILGALAMSLGRRYERTGDPADRCRAGELYGEACALGLDSSLADTLLAARNWGRWAIEQEAWSDASSAYRNGLQASDRLFQIQLLRTDKEVWLRSMRGLHAAAAYAMAKAGDITGAAAAMEAGRARLLSQALERDRADLARLRDENQPLYQRYVAAAGRVSQLESSELASETALASGQDWAATMRAARDELDQAIAAIRQVAGYAGFLASPTFAQVRAVAVETGYPLVYPLSTGPGGLALIVWPDGEPEALWLEGVTETELRQRFLGSGAELGGYLGAYEAWRRDSRSMTAREAWMQALASMIAWLGEAIMNHVGCVLRKRGYTQAALIPAGYLGLLPLHAVDPEMAYTYAPNALALGKAQDVAAACAPADMLLVDNPNPTPRLSLHWAVTECLAVSGVFAAAKCLHLQGRQADTDAVEAALADHAVWHFATHGAGGWNDAMDGHLLLADEQKLTVRQLLGLRVNARLAVLSACETSVPGLELPDEVVSLPTAMIQAGAAGVVGSLWSVDDLSTALLMIRFYIAWRKEGCDPPQALAVAQRWLRESSNAEFAAYFDPQNSQDGADYRAAIPLRVMTRLSGEFKPYTQDERPFEHPYFWAGFCYTGV